MLPLLLAMILLGGCATVPRPRGESTLPDWGKPVQVKRGFLTNHYEQGGVEFSQTEALVESLKPRLSSCEHCRDSLAGMNTYSTLSRASLVTAAILGLVAIYDSQSHAGGAASAWGAAALPFLGGAVWFSHLSNTRLADAVESHNTELPPSDAGTVAIQLTF